MDLRKKASPELFSTINEDQAGLLELTVSQETSARVRERLKQLGLKNGQRLFIFNLGEGSIPLREWPLEHFIVLANMILNDADNHLAVMGTSCAASKVNLFFNGLNQKRCIDLTGKTTIEEGLAVLSSAAALIANDCGLAHLAGLTVVKKFVFFGPESPQVYSPLGRNVHILHSGLPCSPCLSAFNHRNSTCRDNRCLKAISPENAYQFIMENL